MTEEYRERAIRFTTKEAFANAVRQLWRIKPFDLAGYDCLIVPSEVADEILEQFQGEVEEVTFVDLADLPLKEAVEAHVKRFERFQNR